MLTNNAISAPTNPLQFRARYLRNIQHAFEYGPFTPANVERFYEATEELSKLKYTHDVVEDWENALRTEINLLLSEIIKYVRKTAANDIIICDERAPDEILKRSQLIHNFKNFNSKFTPTIIYKKLDENGYNVSNLADESEGKFYFTFSCTRKTITITKGTEK